MMIFLRILCLTSIVAIFVQCGESETTVPAPSSQCATSTAMIGVYDAHLAILCGCSEAAGTTQLAGNTLDCTVSAPMTVVFQYVNTKLNHQIRFDSDAIPDGPLSVGGKSDRIRTHGVHFDAGGTYSFSDGLLSGQIIVQ